MQAIEPSALNAQMPWATFLFPMVFGSVVQRLHEISALSVTGFVAVTAILMEARLQLSTKFAV
jgi:hypothetical protein